jgi:glycosyltransferase involved in cell wall biosynthesis
MNVAILVAGLPPERVGGAETQASHVAARLAERHRVTVLSRTSTIPTELAATPSCSVVRRCRVTLRGVRFFADLVQTLSLLRPSQQNVDVIVAYQTSIDGLIGVLAKMLFGIPVIVSIRSDMEYQLDRFWQSRLLSPFVFRHADRLAVQSPRLGEELLRAFESARRRTTATELRSKLFVLPNGIEVGAARSTEGRGIAYVGRLTRSKGVDTLVQAMRRCPHEHLTIVGDGPDRPRLQKAARGVPNISFAGRVEPQLVPELMRGVKLLVLPSRQEGQPNVILEAMALGVPVLATRVGGVPDLISHGRSGWLVEPDDADALAEAITTLCADRARRQQLAASALVDARKYSWPAVLEVLERQLREVSGEVASRRQPRLRAV